MATTAARSAYTLEPGEIIFTTLACMWDGCPAAEEMCPKTIEPNIVKLGRCSNRVHYRKCFVFEISLFGPVQILRLRVQRNMMESRDE